MSGQQVEAQNIFAELIDPVTGRYIAAWGVIIPGAGVDAEQVEAAMVDLNGDDHDRVISEVRHLRFHKRIKRCERLDGWGCDMQGEWHSHWEGVRHNPAAPDCCYVVALPVFDEPADPANGATS